MNNFCPICGKQITLNETRCYKCSESEEEKGSIEKTLGQISVAVKIIDLLMNKEEREEIS